MKASTFVRIAAVLLLLFDVGHTVDFRQSDPTWGVDALLASMRSIHFEVQGFSLSYWDLFVGAGLNVSILLLLAAALAWQLGGLPAETLALMRGTVWTLALCFLAMILHFAYCLLNGDYGVPDCRMAFSEASLKSWVAIRTPSPASTRNPSSRT